MTTMRVFSPYIAPGVLDIPEKKRELNEIVRIVADELDTTITDLQVKSRKMKVRRNRQIVMYLLHYLGFTYKRIGDYFIKDHATVVHACKTVENDMIIDREMRNFVILMKNRLK